MTLTRVSSRVILWKTWLESQFFSTWLESSPSHHKSWLESRYHWIGHHLKKKLNKQSSQNAIFIHLLCIKLLWSNFRKLFYLQHTIVNMYHVKQMNKSWEDKLLLQLVLVHMLILSQNPLSYLKWYKAYRIGK